MLATVDQYLENKVTSLNEVIFCLWSMEDLETFEKALRSLSHSP
jgi:O-acetyl-ADP-ribose deacetylase (regulator of RNase III)